MAAAPQFLVRQERPLSSTTPLTLAQICSAEVTHLFHLLGPPMFVLTLHNPVLLCKEAHFYSESNAKKNLEYDDTAMQLCWLIRIRQLPHLYCIRRI